MTTVDIIRRRLDSLHIMLGVVMALGIVNLTLAVITLLGM